ncbi:hypothetical protein [Pinirhizobacter soli]|uniref:hypothetical protein n=1 Tax=Pinirhizobacter soli TaxID=2786953 RepID=UPI00202A1757|nr:hypothetical protein [Pinirhizobacter soli]
MLASIAKQAFSYLAVDYGMQIVIANDKVVRFESPSVFVQIRFDHDRSYELGVELGLIDTEDRHGPPFNLVEVMREKHAPEADYVAHLQMSSSIVDPVAANKLALFLRYYARDLLEGNSMGFAKIASRRNSEVLEYDHARRLRLALAESDNAWESLDFARVAQLLEPFLSSLSPAQKLRLKIAKTRSDNR